MVKLTGVLSRLEEKKILVAGDLMLDSYTIGKARRISPEAPVAVVHVQREDHLPGGAGNVVLNLVSMGIKVSLLGRVGNDNAGALLKELFEKEGVDTAGLIKQEAFYTPVKNRIIADNQQIVRVDHELMTPLPEMLEQQICEMVPSLMEGVDVLAISDYGKGFLSRTLLSTLIDYAKAAKIPVISDPKGTDFSKYNGSTIVKPNLSEAYAAANLSVESSLDLVASQMHQRFQADVFMITRSEHGISLFHKDGQRDDFPVSVREVKDVTGAGDTVLAMLACALANGLTLTEAVQLSNIAAGIAIEKLGCARISLGDLATCLLQSNMINKVFDEDHLFALKKFLEGKEYTVLNVSGVQGMSSSLFKAIREAAGNQKTHLLVFVRDAEPDIEFINILAALPDVSLIILSSSTLKDLSEQLVPKDVFIFQDDKLEQLSNNSSYFST